MPEWKRRAVCQQASLCARHREAGEALHIANIHLSMLHMLAGLSKPLAPLGCQYYNHLIEGPNNIYYALSRKPPGQWTNVHCFLHNANRSSPSHLFLWDVTITLISVREPDFILCLQLPIDLLHRWRPKRRCTNAGLLAFNMH